MNQRKLWQDATNTTNKGKVVYESDINQAYDFLAVAIIRQAIKDNVGKDFFTSDFYLLLTTNLPSLQNGEAVYRQICKNRSNGLKHGLSREYDD